MTKYSYITKTRKLSYITKLEKLRHISSPADILEKARRAKYAIGAFNVSDLLTLKAIENAAVKLRAPVIVETSPGETAFLGMENEVDLLNNCSKRTGLPFLSNLDHATTYKDVAAALKAGYQMLHFDGSLLPVATNVRILKKIVPLAHKHGRLVEGELDHITGSSELHRSTRTEQELARGHMTDPDAAAAFVKATNIDIFAVFVGNVHGVFANQERLAIARLKAIRESVVCHVSLHGGSGIRSRDVRAAIRLGVTKVNVNTELREAHISTLRSVLANNRREIAPYKLFPPVIAAIQKVVEKKILLFGSTGKA